MCLFSLFIFTLFCSFINKIVFCFYLYDVYNVIITIVISAIISFSYDKKRTNFNHKILSTCSDQFNVNSIRTIDLTKIKNNFEL